MHAFLDIQLHQGMGCVEGSALLVPLEFHMSLGQGLLLDRKLSATDEGPHDKRLSAHSTHKDLELIEL